MQNTPNNLHTTTALDEIVAHKRAELAARKQHTSEALLKQRLAPCLTSFEGALAGPGIKLIAEIKPKSPSAGQLAADYSLDRITQVYGKHAAAISVLTDERYFGGSVELLRHVAGTVPCPVLCKEFVIDPYQIYEARAAGAAAVLLIVKILDDALLAQLKALTESLGMAAVIEVQTDSEAQRALSVQPSVILVNNRNLATFAVDLQTTAVLARQIPPSISVIAASGIETRADIDQLLQHTNKFLIGSCLMRSTNLEQKMQELCAI